MSIRIAVLAAGVAAAGVAAAADSADTDRSLDQITIIGSSDDVVDTTGAGVVLSAADLEVFAHADVQRILREVPGVSIQSEDGYGLRPNLSIRGTATERSARITLLEDNVLIAPAPYSAPSAYYFPTAGRMQQVEVLKGSAAVRQGPYTIGGAMNFLSTAIPSARGGFVTAEIGEDATGRLHAAYGDSARHYGWLVEGHLWNSDGYQDIARSERDTGLDKDDWMAKFRLNSDPAGSVYHQLDVKLQFATENSDQSYLGLTDADFGADPYLRYGLSELDNIDTEHEQVILRYRAQFGDSTAITATAYNNTHERDWFKTEGVDFDGSSSADDFSRTSWFNVVQGINTGAGVSGATAGELDALLNGAESAPGAIQLRNNAREYYSRGVELALTWQLDAFGARHDFDAGIRYHEDEEDRLQRNSTYTQTAGDLLLADPGRLGNAGNRLQEARAVSLHLTDRIDFGRLVLTPGLRFEQIDQERTRWEIRPGRTADPASREAANLRDYRSNSTDVLIPGLGALYELTDAWSVYGGVHKGFTAPTNAPGVDEEESVNFELGVRYRSNGTYVDAGLFLTDYDNLLGVCTASSGADCEVGDAFNGDAASIRGLELLVSHDWHLANGLKIPLQLAYTYLDGSFDSDIADTDFFGDVSDGDPLPYIPEHQWQLSIGVEAERTAVYANVNYVDEACVRATCGAFETTDSATVVDLAAHYRLYERLRLYGRIDNVFEDDSIVGRQPYGARPGRDRTAAIGLRADF